MASKTDKGPESGLWKDYLNRDSVSKLAAEIGRTFKRFDQSAFVDSVLGDGFERLELKQRIFKIADCLNSFLPYDYARIMRAFGDAAPSLGGFENWALMAYIEKYGLDNFEQSVKAMKELTRYSTAEFAIRPYMIRYESEMLRILHRWATDTNEHVRRLAAEGSRPRGVWTLHLDSFKNNPDPVLKLLEKLKADPSLYVRKAVANNLNDISKDHPERVIETALAWKRDGNEHTDWIVKHACRGLIKKGHPKVFPIFGFTTPVKVEVSGLGIEPKHPRIGSSVSLSFDLISKSKRNQKLAIDYKIHFVKKNGKLSPKVFKLSEKTIRPGEKIHIGTQHSFENRSTRTHFPGMHRIELMVNGVTAHSAEFTLKV